MNEQEALNKLKEIALDDDDTEKRHIKADELIIDFLRVNGFKELSTAYCKLTDDVWYA